MELLLWILAGTFAVSLLGFVGVFSFWMKEQRLKRFMHVLTAFAVGGLLGGAFFHLLPEAAEVLEPSSLFLYALIGFIVFLLIESYFHWHFCEECDVHPYSYMMVIGDAIHNTIDGLVIAASFLVSVPLGIVTTVVIFAHEFPQQLGMFGVLVNGGLDKKKAVIYSYLAQSTVIVGGLLGYILASSVVQISSFLIPFAAGGFLYIAASDLIPEMHKEERMKKLSSIAILFLGLLFMWALKALGAG